MYMQSVVFIMHPRSTLTVLTASQRGCMINAMNCVYSTLPSDDEWLIYSKHVKDNY